jgi:hypothetical protein
MIALTKAKPPKQITRGGVFNLTNKPDVSTGGVRLLDGQIISHHGVEYVIKGD